MKVVYDQEVDVLRIVFNTAAIEESDEEKPGVILDYDSDGNLVGLEVLEASKRIGLGGSSTQIPFYMHRHDSVYVLPDDEGPNVPAGT